MVECILLAAGLVVAAGGAWAQDDDEDKDDVVIFMNGDRLTGEVRGLRNGQLSFNTDATGTIAIEWDDVARLISDQRYEVWTTSGDRYLGQLAEPAESGNVNVESPLGGSALEIRQVVEIAEIEARLLDSLDFDVRAGYSYSKASDITQLTFGWDFSRRRERIIQQASFDTSRSSSSDTESSERSNFGWQVTRLMSDRWMWGGLALFESNDELSLDLRTSLIAAGGRILQQTNRERIEVMGGLALTNENSTVTSQEDGHNTTIEAVFAADLNWFRFDTPELDISTQFLLFPSLSDTGEFRTTLDVDFRWEIIEDLSWGFTLYHTHDSDPPSLGSENDYGITTSLGWEF